MDRPRKSAASSVATSVRSCLRSRLPRKTKITLRHLLSHTAGFAYSMYSKELKAYTEKTGKSEFDGSVEGTFGLPLVAEPGTEWHYSISLDCKS